MNRVNVNETNCQTPGSNTALPLIRCFPFTGVSRRFSAYYLAHQCVKIGCESSAKCNTVRITRLVMYTQTIHRSAYRTYCKAVSFRIVLLPRRVASLAISWSFLCLQTTETTWLQSNPLLPLPVPRMDARQTRKLLATSLSPPRRGNAVHRFAWTQGTGPAKTWRRTSRSWASSRRHPSFWKKKLTDGLSCCCVVPTLFPAFPSSSARPWKSLTTFPNYRAAVLPDTSPTVRRDASVTAAVEWFIPMQGLDLKTFPFQTSLFDSQFICSSVHKYFCFFTSAQAADVATTRCPSDVCRKSVHIVHAWPQPVSVYDPSFCGNTSQT